VAIHIKKLVIFINRTIPNVYYDFTPKILCCQGAFSQNSTNSNSEVEKPEKAA
jgi:hypothetical protein